MSEGYIIAIDEGTSSCRAILVDLLGKVVAIRQQEFTQLYPQADWVEHNPLEIWEKQMQVLDSLIQEEVRDISLIKAIGITNQRETTVVWNKHTGKPVYNAIVWQDKRTTALCNELKAEGFEDYAYANTGLKADPYFSGTKVKWLLEHTDENPENLLFGTIDTWLIWKMTEGKSHVTDYTNASRTLLYNIKSKNWDKKILDRFNIPSTILPQVQASASHFGNYNYKGHDILITGVAGDQQAALFGQACFEKGQAKNTYGTGCFMLMNIGNEFVQSENGLLTTLACDENGGVTYALEGSIFIAGAGIQWLRDGLGIIVDSKETEALAESVKDDNEVYFVPAFAGLGSPYWDMDARGSIYGLTRATTKAHLVKATLDGIAYQTKDVLEAMEKDSGQELAILKVDGGACQNNYLMQFQSDILGASVERPQNVETTAMGAAYLAGITLGIWSSDNIIANRAIDKTFVAEKTSEKVDKLYAKWKDAIKRSRSWKLES